MQTQTLLSHGTYSHCRGRCRGHARHTDHTVAARGAAHDTPKTFLLRREEWKLGALKLFVKITAFIFMLVGIGNCDCVAARGTFFLASETIL